MSESLNITVGPAIEPVTVDLVKKQFGLDSSYALDDDLIAIYIGAARELVEAIAKCSLVNRQYTWHLDAFPNQLANVAISLEATSDMLDSGLYPYRNLQTITLPKPPLVSVDEVAYYDESGERQVISEENYTIIAGENGRLFPAEGETWPATQNRPGAVEVTFTAGEGESIPLRAKHAILLYAAHGYRNREAVSPESLKEVDLGFRSLARSLNRGSYV